jgi:hypothetical protein
MSDKGRTARQEAVTLLGKLMDQREKLHQLFDEARETLASTRAMWDVLEKQPDALQVTSCADAESLRRRKVEDIGACEIGIRNLQVMEVDISRGIAEIKLLLEALND